MDGRLGWCSPFAHGAGGLDLEDRSVPANAELKVESHLTNMCDPPTSIPLFHRYAYPTLFVIIILNLK